MTRCVFVVGAAYLWPEFGFACLVWDLWCGGGLVGLLLGFVLALMVRFDVGDFLVVWFV